MLVVILQVISFVVLLSILVIIHELGHLVTAKWAGAKVEEFGLGFPPRAKKLFRKWGTLFTLNWIPIGGFVRILGENGPDEDQQPAHLGKKAKKLPFYLLPRLKRIIVLAAGPGINLIYGVLIFGLVYSMTGIPTLISTARIGRIQADSPAKQAGVPSNVDLVGIKFGDQNYQITNPNQAIELITAHAGQTVTLTTTGECQGEVCQEIIQEFEVYVRTPAELTDPETEGQVGIVWQTEYAKFYPWYQMPIQGMLYGLIETLLIMVMTVYAFGSMIVGLVTQFALPSDLMGPVGLVDQAVEVGVFRSGLLNTLRFSGMISVSLAIINLLPIPALDGGRVVFVILEKLVGRKRIEAIEYYATYGGYMLLIFLMVAVTSRDVFRVINKYIL